MKPALIFALSAAFAAVTAFLVTQFASKNAAGANDAHAAVSPATDDVGRLVRSVDALEKRSAELQKGLDDLRMDLARRQDGSTRIPVGDLDAAVSRALDQRGAKASAAGASKTADAPDAAAFDARATFAALTTGKLSHADRQALWKAAKDAGKLEELLAMVEDFAKQNPNDPHAQCELGKAYLQKLFTVGDGPEKGKWAMMADKQFDKALGLDDHDWDSRFQKAVSLSFWPPLFGKQNAAIQNFEVLVKQQEGLPSQPEFAQTHLMLGNMYLQMGDKQKALATWQNGLTLFPDNADLLGQIAQAQAH